MRTNHKIIESFSLSFILVASIANCLQRYLTLSSLHWVYQWNLFESSAIFFFFFVWRPLSSSSLHNKFYFSTFIDAIANNFASQVLSNSLRSLTRRVVSRTFIVLIWSQWSIFAKSSKIILRISLVVKN